MLEPSCKEKSICFFFYKKKEYLSQTHKSHPLKPEAERETNMLGSVSRSHRLIALNFPPFILLKFFFFFFFKKEKVLSCAEMPSII